MDAFSTNYIDRNNGFQGEEMMKTINDWTEELKSRFDEREKSFMRVHKALIQLQLKDTETGNIELHNIEYISKEAQNLKLEVR